MIQRLSYIQADLLTRQAEYNENNNINSNNNNELATKIDYANKEGERNDFLNKRKAPLTILFISLSLYFIWIWVGIIFYKYHNSWTLGTAYYYTMEAGLSIGFCNPSEPNDSSKLFTIFFVLIGSSLIAGSLGALASRMISQKAILLPIEYIRDITFKDKETNKITIKSFFIKIWYEFKVFLGWYSHRERVYCITAFIIWMGLGCVYGMLVEDWSFITSLYWAVTSCSTGGLQSANCIRGTTGDTCDIGYLRGGLMGTYFLIGVPIYACTMGQFAGIAIQNAVLEDRMNLLKKPINQDEFEYCCNILSPEGSTTLNCGEYILLELMRLKAVKANQIESIKREFNNLDLNNIGVLTIHDLKECGRVVSSKSNTSLSNIIPERIRSSSVEIMDYIISRKYKSEYAKSNGSDYGGKSEKYDSIAGDKSDYLSEKNDSMLDDKSDYLSRKDDISNEKREYRSGKNDTYSIELNASTTPMSPGMIVNTSVLSGSDFDINMITPVSQQPMINKIRSVSSIDSNDYIPIDLNPDGFKSSLCDTFDYNKDKDSNL